MGDFATVCSRRGRAAARKATLSSFRSSRPGILARLAEGGNSDAARCRPRAAQRTSCSSTGKATLSTAAPARAPSPASLREET